MESTLVRHGHPMNRAMPISPLDAYEDHFPVGYVAFYRNTLDPAALRRALARVLPRYPLLTGRMTRDARGLKAIALNDAGLGFEVRETLETLADWRDPDRNRIARFVRLELPQHPLRARRPLMHLRVTQLAGGGSVLGIGFGHVLADGTGIAGFLRDWARAARGEPIGAPMWDRDEHARAFRPAGFDPAAVPVHAARYVGLSEATLPELGLLYAHLLRALPHWRGYTVPLRGADLERLKSGAGGAGSAGVSSNDLLSALLWKVLVGAQALPGEQRSRFFGVADLRKHTPGVPEQGVFGCMSGHTLLEVSARDVGRHDVYELARRLRAQTQSLGAERFHQQEVWLRHRQLRRTMYRVLGAEPYAGDVSVSNCRFIPFYDTDFGGGRPYFFNLPAEAFPRVVIWPAADGDGCVLNLNLTRAMAARVLPTLTRRGWLARAAVADGQRALRA